MPWSEIGLKESGVLQLNNMDNLYELPRDLFEHVLKFRETYRQRLDKFIDEAIAGFEESSKILMDGSTGSFSRPFFGLKGDWSAMFIGEAEFNEITSLDFEVRCGGKIGYFSIGGLVISEVAIKILKNQIFAFFEARFEDFDNYPVLS